LKRALASALVWVVGAAGAGCAAGPRHRPAGPPAPADSWSEVNQLFREQYRAARTRTLERLSPVLLLEGDRLVLRAAGQRREIWFLPPIYSTLKVVAHAALAIQVTLSDATPTVELTRLDALARLRDRLPALRTALDGTELAPSTRERQRVILEGSQAFLERVVRSGSCGRAELSAFASQMGPLLAENAAEAARAELDALAEKLALLRHELGPDGMAALTVVVMGSHMARQDEVAMQFFARALGEEGEGRRLIYAEGVWDEARALELLATHRLDASAAAAFFGDPMRLHRDMLGDGARQYLETQPR
jgi:hypothetical protein